MLPFYSSALLNGTCKWAVGTTLADICTACTSNAGNGRPHIATSRARLLSFHNNHIELRGSLQRTRPVNTRRNKGCTGACNRFDSHKETRRRPRAPSTTASQLRLGQGSTLDELQQSLNECMNSCKPVSSPRRDLIYAPAPGALQGRETEYMSWREMPGVRTTVASGAAKWRRLRWASIT